MFVLSAEHFTEMNYLILSPTDDFRQSDFPHFIDGETEWVPRVLPFSLSKSHHFDKETHLKWHKLLSQFNHSQARLSIIFLTRLWHTRTENSLLFSDQCNDDSSMIVVIDRVINVDYTVHMLHRSVFTIL